MSWPTLGVTTCVLLLCRTSRVSVWWRCLAEEARRLEMLVGFLAQVYHRSPGVNVALLLT